jgi:sugar/nucleoside kinase (ribokinase family)
MDAAIFGLIVADVIAQGMDFRDAPPPPRGLQRLQSLSLTSGGPVSNCGISTTRLGMRVAAAGLVGRDAFGAALRARLRDAGLDTTCVFESPDAPTSATVVAVEPGGERCFFHAPGTTALLDAATFRACFDTFRRCARLHIGYFGLLPITLMRELGALLRELRAAAPETRISLDTANRPSERDVLDTILPHLDVFCPSRDEGAALTGESDPLQMVTSFRRAMPRGLIGIKLDSDGCYLDDGREALMVGAYPVNVVDTTGAGDAWYAGLLTGLHNGLTLKQCGQLANRAAADCCTMLGGSDGVRSFADTIARI